MNIYIKEKIMNKIAGLHDIEDEYQLEAVYESIYGYNGINRFTHNEFIDRLLELYDFEQQHMEK